MLITVRALSPTTTAYCYQLVISGASLDFSGSCPIPAGFGLLGHLVIGPRSQQRLVG